MDRDRERFARMAERAKQPPFTPLENLLVRGSASKITPSIDPDYTGCTCEACMGPTIDTDPRVADKLDKMRARKGITVEEPVAPASASPARRATLTQWANLIWTTTPARRADYADSATYAIDSLAVSSNYAGQAMTDGSIVWNPYF